MRPHALPIGTELGGYVLHGVLGAGASGTVYRATDAEGIRVALKLLHPEVAAGAEARTRLRREVAAQRRIRSPLVARVVDAELDQAEAFVVTELVEGETLDAAIAKQGPWPSDQLADLGERLVVAIEAVHQAGVVHRDIKPSNVMLRPDGSPVLIDFGIAQGDTSARLTGTGLVAGTPGFVAPELLRGDDPTPGSDRFAVAATLLRAATGRAPFGGGPVDAVLARVLEGAPDTGGLDQPIQQAFRAALSPVEASRLGLDDLVEALRSGQFEEALPPTAHLPGPAAAPTSVAFGGPVGDATQPLSPDGRRELLEPLPASGLPVYAPSAAGATQPGVPDVAPSPGFRDAIGLPPVGPPKCRLLVACLWVAAAVIGAGWPIPTGAVVLVLLILARTVWEAHAAQAERLRRRGPKRSDAARTAVATPWYLLRGLVGSLLPAGLGIAVAVGGYWLIKFAADPDTTRLLWLAGGAVAVGAAIGWWGPSAQETRDGARLALAWLLPTRVARVLVGVAALVGGGIGAWLLIL
jgi:serine/threonine protein kinase